MKVAALGDVHCAPDIRGRIRELLEGAAGADLLVLAGDLTNLGKPEELEALLSELGVLTMPVVAVFGNHDYEGEQVGVLTEMLQAKGVTLLDGTSCRLGDVDVIGTKGFCGGFGPLRVQPFGEPALKTFILSTIDEMMRFEAALKASTAPRKFVVMHYAPIKETLAGEEPELFPFLGCSIFEDVLDAYKVNAVVHAHAHNGTPFGRTKGGITVYNVSRFVRARAGLPPVLILDV